MKAADIQRALSLYQFTHKRVEAISTELRKAGLLPKAGRGRHAPEIEPETAARFALAVAGAERVSDAAEVCQTLAGLVDREGSTLADRLGTIMGDFEEADRIRHVRVIAESTMAEITRTDGTVEYFFEPGFWQGGFEPAAQGGGFCGRIGHIGGAVLAEIAAAYTHGDLCEAGWVGEEA